MDETMRITYATDFSPASRAAFAQALRLARATGRELTILHVLLSPASMFVAGGFVSREVWNQIESEVQSRATEAMDALVKEAADAGVRVTARFVHGGIPADEIVRAAAENKTDVLVLGTHGRSGVMKLTLGSVAARVVATATCPVLTVRVPDEPGR